MNSFVTKTNSHVAIKIQEWKNKAQMSALTIDRLSKEILSRSLKADLVEIRRLKDDIEAARKKLEGELRWAAYWTDKL